MLGLVLSGGGARGAFQAGVYEKLITDERFRRFDVLSGTSAGAITAALIANGKTATQVRDFWLGLGDDPPVTVDRRLCRSIVLHFAKAFLRHPQVSARSSAAERRSLEAPAPVAWFIEWLLTRRFDLVNDVLESVRQTALVDTRRLREHLVRTFSGEIIETEGAVLAIKLTRSIPCRTTSFAS